MTNSVADEVGARPKEASGLLPVAMRRWLVGGLAAAVWAGGALLTGMWPDQPEQDWAYTGELAVVLAVVAAIIATTVVIDGRYTRFRPLQAISPWLVALALFVAVWEAVTAKYGLLPLPFFPPPQAIAEVILDDWARLAEGIVASGRLLASGYFLGAMVGFVVGVAIGWSRLANYWIHPVLRFIGPLPATAWLPLAFFVFPSSTSASVFLIALATGFPVTVLTWSALRASTVPITTSRGPWERANASWY